MHEFLQYVSNLRTTYAWFDGCLLGCAAVLVYWVSQCIRPATSPPEPLSEAGQRIINLLMKTDDWSLTSGGIARTDRIYGALEINLRRYAYKERGVRVDGTELTEDLTKADLQQIFAMAREVEQAQLVVQQATDKRHRLELLKLHEYRAQNNVP